MAIGTYAKLLKSAKILWPELWWQFQPLIKAMTNVEDIFDNDFFGDIADTPKKGIEQHKKREYL